MEIQAAQILSSSQSDIRARLQLLPVLLSGIGPQRFFKPKDIERLKGFGHRHGCFEIIGHIGIDHYGDVIAKRVSQGMQIVDVAFLIKADLEFERPMSLRPVVSVPIFVDRLD